MTGGYSLTYIYHDCFLLETKDAVMIFDYWKDPLSGVDKENPPLLDLIHADKPIYVLVSHHHKDHFTRRIFLWQKRFPSMRYIISRDVAKSVKYMLNENGTYTGFRPKLGSVTILSEGETYEDPYVKVKAFGSTDIGNSYVLESSGYTFFHAGDLNAWTWIEESKREEVDKAREDFMIIVEKIRRDYQMLDVVMFPVDSRQGSEYWWGALHFIECIEANLFVPMHFELVLDEKDKLPRRLDAAAFHLYSSSRCREYLQLGCTRSRYIKTGR